jgi:RNA polymerase sigma-70 factor (ECF subfamily)
MDKRELDEKMLRLQTGDEQAFEEIYNLTKRGLFSFILSICRNYHTAEDIMQSTYLRLKGAISTYQAGSNALAWLFTIAKNLTINELNRAKRESFSDFEDTDARFGEYTLEDKLSGSVLELMGKTLNEEERQIVVLHLIAGFKHREIADMLQKPLGTVLWSYRNSLAKLKRELEKEDKNEA